LRNTALDKKRKTKFLEMEVSPKNNYSSSIAFFNNIAYRQIGSINLSKKQYNPQNQYKFCKKKCHFMDEIKSKKTTVVTATITTSVAKKQPQT
jgi:hypothetical protein